MPAIPAVRLNFPGADPSRVAGFSFTLETGEDSAWVYLPGHPTRAVQVVGDLGGGDVVVEGSMDDPDTETPSASELASIDAEGITALGAATPLVRARLVGGAAGSVVVKLFATSVTDATITVVV